MGQVATNIHERRAAKRKKRWERLLFLYSFLMAFPVIVILGQNASILVFGAIVLFLLQHTRQPLLGIKKPAQWLAALFAFGAILSVLHIPPEAAGDATNRAMSVLPNYLYWSVLIVVLVAQRRIINWEVVYKAVFWGVVMTVLYYLFFQRFLSIIPVFSRMTPNSFAFLMICFTPMAVHYLKGEKGRTWATIFLALLVLVLLRDGRRAGMVLVLLSGIGILYADRISWKRIALAAVLIPLAITMLFTKSVEVLVLQSSERIHEMIYQTDKIRTEDRSYLTRVAMVNKGLAIFKQYPYTGIGLNNFSNFSVDFDKSFEGASFVVRKAEIQKKSAHNSYVAILAEGGLFLLVPLLLILTYNIIYFLLHFNRLSSYLPVYVGLIAMSVHLYFISAIVNVFAWYLIGLACSITTLKKWA